MKQHRLDACGADARTPGNGVPRSISAQRGKHGHYALGSSRGRSAQGGDETYLQAIRAADSCTARVTVAPGFTSGED